MSQPIRTARARVMETPELLVMIARAAADTRALVRMQNLSREFRRYSLHALAAILVPELFLRLFFDEAVAAVAKIRESDSLICGLPLREYMYTQRTVSNRLVIITRESCVDDVAGFLLDHDYELYTSGRVNPFEEPTCATATIVVRFRRELPNGRKLYVSIQGSLHHPLRLLFRTTQPHAMQFCDGLRFVDLYPRLGPEGPHLHVSRGRHPHLLDTQELMRNLPPQTFDLRSESKTHGVVSIERWIGDDNTWIAPHSAPDTIATPLETFGWTIRLIGRRPAGTPYAHFWTTTFCRCLRHAFIVGEYVLPQPAQAYAERVLERMHDSLAVGVGDVILNTDGSAMDFDIAVVQSVAAFRSGGTYSFLINGYTIEVERDGCVY